jgi:hypothetical protein
MLNCFYIECIGRLSFKYLRTMRQVFVLRELFWITVEVRSIISIVYVCLILLSHLPYIVLIN